MLYKCEVCGKTFTSEDKCLECENRCRNQKNELMETLEAYKKAADECCKLRKKIAELKGYYIF